ncbi:molybdopterin molybdotransferase MoeA [Bacterioplanoides sp.]|uniref:molybdopterin molybdotransferase MoeA n=1 Tax=Bacterioplanoides sp. TaxID=2066072 RepID=UPI003B5CEBC9
MNDCCSAPGLTPLDQALEQLLAGLKPITETELVSIEEALGRVIAEPVSSALNIPPADNSAMDGYAIRGSDGAEGAVLTLVGKSFAGHPFTGQVGAGECVRIMTGAEIPSGADAVIMQEQVTVDATNDAQVTLQREVRSGSHVRNAGEDIAVGQVVFEPGRKLRAADIGLLSSLGLAEVRVIRRLRVAVLSTGDELKKPGETLEAGQFYESNGYTISAVLHKLNAEITNFGILPDDLETLRSAFRQANEVADVVITSGGVSVGEADFVKDVLDELGEIAFWKLAIKPGKPFAFGFLPDSVFIGLPGNPVSALVTMHQLGVPMLNKISGQESQTSLRIAAKAGCAIKKAPGRTDFQRGIYSTDEQGNMTVVTTGSQGSGMLTSMNLANCYIILEQQRGSVEVGETVIVEPFDSIVS